MTTAGQEDSLADENLYDTLDPVYKTSICAKHGGKVLPPEVEQTHQHSKSVNFGLESSFMSGFKPLTGFSTEGTHLPGEESVNEAMLDNGHLLYSPSMPCIHGDGSDCPLGKMNKQRPNQVRSQA
eukprot:TRINITY_DN3764_c0_g2_i1.p1 TRINITY_DN3764_c0_g2~~TRINITY_DN3764_c0_g2_i1.p1  ORF type:complete len:125 (-),score=11.95 TRINITY_DN3764_c0_g2_i1:145-519(-)